MLTYGVVHLHDSAHLHAAACTGAPLVHFSWELFDHPPYIPDLAPSDCHLFTYQKNWLGSQCFNSNKELMEDIKTWLSPRMVDFFDTGLQKRIPQYDRFLNSGDNYIVK
jgi:hypothetical protein